MRLARLHLQTREAAGKDRKVSAVTQVTAVWFKEVQSVLLGSFVPWQQPGTGPRWGSFTRSSRFTLTNPDEEQRADQRGYGHQQRQPDTLPHLRWMTGSTSSIRDGGPPQTRRGSGILMGSK